MHVFSSSNLLPILVAFVYKHFKLTWAVVWGEPCLPSAQFDCFLSSIASPVDSFLSI